MPLTGAASAHSPLPHMHLGVVDAERLDLDDDVAGFGLGLRNFFVHEAVEASETSPGRSHAWRFSR